MTKSTQSDDLGRALADLEQAGQQSIATGPFWLRALYRKLPPEQLEGLGKLFFGWSAQREAQVRQDVAAELRDCLRHAVQQGTTSDLPRLFDDGLLFVGLRQALPVQSLFGGSVTRGYREPPFPAGSLPACRLAWITLLYELGQHHLACQRQRESRQRPARSLDLTTLASSTSGSRTPRPLAATDDELATGSEQTIADLLLDDEMIERAVVSRVGYVVRQIMSDGSLSYWGYTSIPFT